MTYVQDEFAAELQSAVEAAAADRDKIKVFEDIAKRHPAAAAAEVSRLVPRFMERWRTQARDLHGVDIAARDWEKRFKSHRQHAAAEASLAEAGLLLMRANYFLVFAWCKTKLDALAVDMTLSDEERAQKACEVGAEALRGIEQAYLHNLEEMLLQTRGEAEKLVKDELAARLAGQLATRISLSKNRRLKTALDEIRETNKPANRVRFEALLGELYVTAPEGWAEHHVSDWLLVDTRNASVKKIEKRHTPGTEEVELATFAERAALLRRGRKAGLAPREYEIFKLFVTHPGIKYREVADILGVSVGTVSKSKSRIAEALSKSA
jgi:DNA-binding CsgD family transcriptional regulator